MQDEAKRKQFIQNTFNTVAQDYGLRASRFFHLSGELMAELLGLDGDESVLDVASGTGAAALPLAKLLPQGAVTAETSVITMNMKVKAAGSDDVFWMDNYVLTIAVVSGGVDLTMSGRFYHPSHGYVDISTSTPFHYAGTNLYPYPGVMVAAGSNGSTATLTSLSTTEYQIDIHTGTSVHSNTGLWAEL